VKIKPHSRVVDIGTGGGLPGIPIKILRPDLTILLIDATRKKTNAVSEIIRDIGISKINVEWGRAEDIGLKPCFHKKFDLVFARAVASISKLVDWSKLFLVEREKGELNIRNERRGKKIVESPALIAYKGGDLTKEIDAIKQQKKILIVRTIELPINNYKSNLICDTNKKIVIVNF
jgi:16S rRNA (guanine(527)-N(7))-methyltransferase RsmG